MISLISILRYKDYSITYNGRPIRDLGYDCSGLLCAANNANPDRSHTFNPAYSGTTYLFNFMSKSSDYIKITNLSDLKEGDFIIRKGVHALIVVKDESGHLVLAEAKESGTKVGTNLRTLESIKNALKKGIYVGFHDTGNDKSKTKSVPFIDGIKGSPQFGASSRGWSAENGLPPER